MPCPFGSYIACGASLKIVVKGVGNCVMAEFNAKFACGNNAFEVGASGVVMTD